MPKYVQSDRLAWKEEKHKEMMEYMGKEPEFIPVDLVGARTDFVKGEDNLEKSIEDVKRRYDLDLPISREEKKGGQI